MLEVSQRRVWNRGRAVLVFHKLPNTALEFVWRNDSQQSKKKMDNSRADCTGMPWKEKLVESLKRHFSASVKITSRLLCLNSNDTGETGNINCSLCYSLGNEWMHLPGINGSVLCAMKLPLKQTLAKFTEAVCMLERSALCDTVNSTEQGG